MSTVTRSVSLSAASNYAIVAVQLISSIVLARLLTPAEIGIFSVAAVVVAVSHSLRDFGVSNYLLQERDLTVERMRSAQGILLVIGVGLAALLCLAAWPLAAFYEEPRVRSIVQVLALSFVFLPFGALTNALLRRDLAFGALAFINLASAAAQALVSVVAASRGMGVMSLAWGALASPITGSIASLFFRRPGQPWVPGFREARHVARIGTQFSASSAAQELNLAAPDLISAHFLGFTATGLLSRATGMVSMASSLLISTVQSVYSAHFADLSRNQPAQVQPVLIRWLEALCMIIWPVLALLMVCGSDVIVLLYGPQWKGAGPVASLLCLGGMLVAVRGTLSSFLIATGQVTVLMHQTVRYLLLKIVLVLLGVLLGLNGLVMGILLSELAQTFDQLRLTARLLNARAGLFLRALRNPLLLSVVVAGACGLSLWMASGLSVFFRVAVCGMTGLVIWVAWVWWTRHFLFEDSGRVVVRVAAFLGGKP
ncbi:MAG: oligosaccharide flippase family protein [Betaproteobacteria bacterium]